MAPGVRRVVPAPAPEGGEVVGWPPSRRNSSDVTTKTGRARPWRRMLTGTLSAAEQGQRGERRLAPLEGERVDGEDGRRGRTRSASPAVLCGLIWTGEEYWLSVAPPLTTPDQARSTERGRDQPRNDCWAALSS